MLVHPLHCRKLAGGSWRVRLRCPDCARVWSESVAIGELERLDRDLAAGRRVLVEHLREIERIEREGEIERFTSALAADAILPEDFAA